MSRGLLTFRRNSLAAFGTAVLLTIAAVLAQIALSAIVAAGAPITNQAPYFAIFLAAAASAAIGGFWPGITSAVLGLLGSALLSGSSTLEPANPRDWIGPIRFLVVAVFVSLLCDRLIVARERARTAEQRLRESERIYRAIGESIPFGVWICDAQGRLDYASEAILKLTGMRQEDFLGFGWSHALHPDDETRILPAWQRCVREQGIWDVEMRYRGVNGAYHPVLACGVPVRDEHGRILCWAGMNLDISRLKDTETALQKQAEELQRSNRDLEQFAFVASHDMQEPLRMVSIYAELLLQRVGEHRSTDLDTFAGFVRDGVKRMEKLIRDLLSFSRVIHSDVQTAAVDSGAALQDALEVITPLIRDSGGDLSVDSLPLVVADRANLSRVFQNLLSNAVKYRKSRVPPQIRISAQMEKGEAVFRVDDNGIGFDPAYSELVFKLFTRLNGSQYEGSGIGLAICQRIVERYGGRMWVDSKPGEGSSFFFALPAAEAAASERVSTQRATP